MALPPMSKRDSEQVLRYAFDDDTGRLRVDAAVTVAPGGISAADGDNIAISDGVDTVVVNPDGSINTNISGQVQIELDAQDGDNVALADAATGDTMKVRPDGNATVISSNTLITDPFDYISAQYPVPTVEIYTYRLGGVAGSIVGVITVTYTDASKQLITSVSKA